VKDTKTARMAAKLKKVMQEYELLKKQNEELLKEKRVQLVTAKLANDSKQRLKQYHLDNLRLTQEVDTLRKAVQSLEQDIQIVTEDSKEIRQSEHHLREERAKTLSEVTQLRERVRELDNERKRYAQINR
jgi:predicted nuclease with TOPRIM domain